MNIDSLKLVARIILVVISFATVMVIIIPWVDFVINRYWCWCDKIKRGIK